ncbi:MAG: pyrroloquinoline quinone precursor peptide PqqA [Acidobacteria bacterium]|nr:MAG: pyrroloquinoline quinone precursor peptide PqqA [Acidobacteriota bacterium]
MNAKCAWFDRLTMSAHPEPRRRMRALRAYRCLARDAVGARNEASFPSSLRHPYGRTENLYCAIAVWAAHSYNSTLGVRPTPCRQETRIGGRVDTLDLRCAPMTWTKPEFEVVAVTMEITAYSATR